MLTANLLSTDAEFGTALAQLPQQARAAAVGAIRTVTVLWNRAMQPQEVLWSLVVTRLRRPAPACV